MSDEAKFDPQKFRRFLKVRPIIKDLDNKGLLRNRYTKRIAFIAAGEQQKKLDTKQEELEKAEEAREEAQKEAGIDTLTGLSRRKPFSSEVRKEIEVIKRDPSHERGLIVAIGDLDDFGMYNKLHGEHVGDQVLEGLGNKLKDKTRPTDEVCRWGGEEFAIAMRYSKVHEKEVSPEHPIDRLRKKTDSVEITDNGESRTEAISLTFGATEFEPNDAFETMMEKAGNALKIAKLLGKRRTVLAEHNYFRDLSTGKTYILKKDDQGEILEDIVNKVNYRIAENPEPKARPILVEIA